MEELFRIIFEAFPEKSTITFEGTCSDCGNSVNIGIVPTLEGFGLLGGAFVGSLTDKYVAKCPDCFKVNSMRVEHYKANPDVLKIFDKKTF